MDAEQTSYRKIILIGQHLSALVKCAPASYYHQYYFTSVSIPYKEKKNLGSWFKPARLFLTGKGVAVYSLRGALTSTRDNKI